MDNIIQLGFETDIDELERLYDDLNDYLAETVNYPGWIKGIYPIRQNAADGVEQGKLYVARRNGRIAGSIVLNHKPEAAYAGGNWALALDASDMIVVHTFVVHPQFLKCGVGRALMDFAEGHSRQLGVKAIRLDVYEGNGPAIRLYEKCGFQYAGTVDLGLGMYGLDWFRLYEKVL